MTTCQQIITQALRKLNAVPIGAVVNPAEIDNGLTVLQSLYMELVGSGAFGRENDLLSTGDWTVLPNQRVRLDTESATATIPDALPPLFPYWWQGSWGDNWIYWPVWPSACTDQAAASNTCCCVPPDDLSIVTVTDKTAEVSHTYLYDAHIGSWSALDGLTAGTEAPLSRRWADPLATVLAGRLAPYYGDQVSPALAMNMRAGLGAITSKFGTASRPVHAAYF